MPRPVDQDLEPLRTTSQRVLLVVGEMDDTIARPDLVHLLVLPRQARAAEDEHDLLGRAVRVGRSREPPDSIRTRLTPMPTQPTASPEALPARGHLALLAAVGLDVVPVRDVLGRYCSISFLPEPAPISAFIFSSSSSTFDFEVSAASSRSS